MSTLIPTFDRLLGPLSPQSRAHRSAPPPRKAVVFTASGDQGRSVCESLVTSGRFSVRGITSFPQSIAADSLKARGVEIVRGHIGDTASYAGWLEGMDTAFVNMDFLETFRRIGPNDPDLKRAIEVEVRQSIAAVEACHRAGIKHVVYSALDDLPEEVQVPHAVSKAKVVEHLRATTIPCTILYPSHPYSDIVAGDMLRPNDNNDGLILAIPAPDDCTIPGYAVEQVGDWVGVAMKKPHKWIGKDMHACAERSSVAHMAADLSKLLSVPVDTLHISKETFYSAEHREDVGEAMWALYRACYEEYTISHKHLNLEYNIHPPIPPALNWIAIPLPLSPSPLPSKALKLTCRHFTRDPQQSEKIAPRQWTFKQWAAQSKEIKEMGAAVRAVRAVKG